MYNEDNRGDKNTMYDEDNRGDKNTMYDEDNRGDKNTMYNDQGSFKNDNDEQFELTEFQYKIKNFIIFLRVLDKKGWEY